jgi:hypothetical protein
MNKINKHLRGRAPQRSVITVRVPPEGPGGERRRPAISYAPNLGTRDRQKPTHQGSQKEPPPKSDSASASARRRLDRAHSGGPIPSSAASSDVATAARSGLSHSGSDASRPRGCPTRSYSRGSTNLLKGSRPNPATRGCPVKPSTPQGPDHVNALLLTPTEKCPHTRKKARNRLVY